jgi:imidazole glycerol-phosphate synthase subunit HisH
MICIVDYNMGNIGSIKNMLSKIGAESVVSSDPQIISKADKLILPGVGSFGAGMKNLKDLRIIEVLNRRVMNEGIDILGICLGMQLMTKYSEEGDCEGLGWVAGETKKIRDRKLKIPHMGWNIVNHINPSILFKETSHISRFYFVHSYAVELHDPSFIVTTTPYHIDFVSSFQNSNIFGVQFHPEKSHNYGMELLRNFLGLSKC